MEQVPTEKRSPMIYALPALGAAIPLAVVLIRKAMGGKNKDEVLLRKSNLDIMDAMGAALEFVPGTPIEIELDENRGRPVWEVDIVPDTGGPTMEVTIDAKSGDLLAINEESEEFEVCM